MEPHPRFRRKGDDILAKLPLKLSEALLGCSKAIETVWGSRSVRVPTCTQPGARIVVSGAGAPRLRGVGRGNHVLEVEMLAPQRLTAEQLQLVEKLRESGM